MAAFEPNLETDGLADFARAFDGIKTNIEKVIEGKSEVIELALIALLSEGHLLIEDVPGVGKTMLAKAIARSTSCTWRRIQFTPDLLPSDVTGVSIFDTQTSRFVFRPGSVFANIVVGDEINRASPKTQSALLESMEEQQVTIEGISHRLDSPFMVIATQNPIEHEGTYPLPESQLDRFMMRLSMGYPDANNSIAILNKHGADEPIDQLTPVIDVNGVTNLIEIARKVHVADQIKRYIVDLTEATRVHPQIFLGASPRASLFLLRAARTKTASEGRDYVLPDDIKKLAKAVLAHRMLLASDFDLRGGAAEEIVDEILGSTPIPART